MATHLKLSEFDFSGLESTFENATKGFLAVKVRDLFPDTTLPCSMYYPAVRKTDCAVRLVVLLEKGQFFGHDFHEFLVKEGIEETYIRKEDESVYYEYFISNMQKILKSSDLPTERKTELLYDNAETIVKKVFRERPNRSNIALGEQLIENFAFHISTDKVSSKALVSLFSKDYYTFSHCVQVALLGMSFCRFMGWKPGEVTDFGLGALFHDVGKNAIPDEVLNKPSKLDADEFEMIKKHPLLGYQQIKDTHKMSKEQLTVVLHHHEAWDGSGYAHRLKAEGIHKYARLARIVDIYDALTTKRSYKDALPRAEALQLMSNEMRHTLDPAIFDAFTKFLQEETKTDEGLRGGKINLEIGNEALIRVGDSDVRIKAVLVGMESEKYVLFRVRRSTGAMKPPSRGACTAVRYSQSGFVYGFESRILTFLDQPFPLLFLSYPTRIGKIEQKRSTRSDPPAQSEIRLGNNFYKGVIVDLNMCGCRFVLTSPEADMASGIRIDQEAVIYANLPGYLENEQIFGQVRNVSFDQERGSLGLRFLEMSEEAKEYIRSLEQHPKQI